LKYVIKQECEGEYWCIYNGKNANISNRIQSHFSTTLSNTSTNGNLALIRCFSEIELSNNFKIKYIACNNKEGTKSITTSYNDLKKDLERIWRLNNKHPIFCRV